MDVAQIEFHILTKFQKRSASAQN